MQSREKLGKIPSVLSTRSVVVLDTVKESSRLPLDALPGDDDDDD